MFKSLTSQIKSLRQKIDELDEKIPALEQELEDAETEIMISNKKLAELCTRLNISVTETGRMGSGNSFIDTARLLFPYTGSIEGDNYILQGYFIGNDVIIGTNKYVIFEVNVKTPSELQGKYLYYEFVLEPEKIDQYVYPVPYEQGIKTIKDTIDRCCRSMNNKIEVKNINNIVEKEDAKTSYIQLHGNYLCFDQAIFSYLENIFTGKVTVKWSKERAPICIENDSAKIIVAPLTSPYPDDDEWLKELVDAYKEETSSALNQFFALKEEERRFADSHKLTKESVNNEI